MQEIWNIAVVVSKDKDYKVEYNSFIKDVKSSKSHPSIRFIFFEFDTIPDNTKIYKYEFNNIRFDMEVSDNCRDIYNPDDLVNFFKEHVIKEDTIDITNKYMVITWGHGAGLGVFAKIEIPPVPKTTVRNLESHLIQDISALEKLTAQTFNDLIKNTYLIANLSLPDKTLVTTRISDLDETIFNENLTDNENFDTLINDFEENLMRQIPRQLKMLTGQDLAKVFTSSFGTKKIDVLITINCFTQMYEFGSALRDNVSLLVAPQTMIPFFGINYAQLFRFINKNNSPDTPVKPEMIARNITSYFWPKYIMADLEDTFTKKYPTFPLRETSFSCNNLEMYSILEETIGEVGQILNSLKLRDARLGGIIRKARLNCEDLSPERDYGVIDFTLFFQIVLIELHSNRNREPFDKDEEIGNAIDKLNDIYDAFIEVTREKICLSMLLSQGRSYIPYDGNSFDGINFISPSPFFISIFFPSNQKAVISSLLGNSIGPINTAIPLNSKPSYRDWNVFVTELFE